MAINRTPKEKAAGGSYTTTATTINLSNFATNGRQGKAFPALRTADAMNGQSLYGTAQSNGTVIHWAERWRLVRYLPTIDTARQFLEQIGGRL